MDVSWVLENTEAGPAIVKAILEREGVQQRVTLRLKKGWKVGTALDYAWRPSKWQLEPRPGFGGRALSASEKRTRGLDVNSLALEVGYLTLWTEDPRPMVMARSFAGSRPYGLAVQRAGLEKGDIVLSVNGTRFTSRDHLHAWWRLTLTSGKRVALRVVRGEEQRTLWVELP